MNIKEAYDVIGDVMYSQGLIKLH